MGQNSKHRHILTTHVSNRCYTEYHVDWFSHFCDANRVMHVWKVQRKHPVIDRSFVFELEQYGCGPLHHWAVNTNRVPTQNYRTEWFHSCWSRGCYTVFFELEWICVKLIWWINEALCFSQLIKLQFKPCIVTFKCYLNTCLYSILLSNNWSIL